MRGASSSGGATAAPGGGCREGRQAGAATPAPGDVLELTCSDLAFGGEGICRMPSGFVVFVDRALPGERLTARILQSKKSFAKGAKLQTLQEHDDVAQPACQHFGPCGGCSLQALHYPAQLAAKQRQVSDLLSRTAGIADVAAVLRPPVGCPPGQQYGYRNKMEFSFSRDVWQPGQGWQPGQEEPGARRHRGSSSRSSRTSEAGSSADRRGRGGSRDGLRRGPGRQEAVWAPAAVAAADSAGSEENGGISGRQGWQQGRFALGLHKPGSNTAVLPIASCHLQSDCANQLLQAVLQACQQQGLEPYCPQTGTGLLQHVVIRRGGGGVTSSTDSSSSGSSGSSSSSSSSNSSSPATEYLINIVTARDARQALAPLARSLMPWQAQPGLPATAANPATSASSGGDPAAAAAAVSAPSELVVGVVNSVSERGRPAGERRLAAEHVLAGRAFLTERLCGLEFEVSANSFFQTNTQQAEVLYGLVAQAAELRPTDIVLDLYCGTGSIGLTLAASCRQVHGVEISEAAVRDARRNAARNGIKNASFLQGDLQKLQLEGRLPRPDVVVVDPARPGLSPALVAYLRTCGARRIVYVSCNASTQARDIRLLCSSADADSGDAGSGSTAGSGQGPYRLVSMQACDLYPHTWHVETVGVLDAV